MAELIKTEEFTENGIEYIREIYDNGTIVESPKPQPLPDEYTPSQPEPTQLDVIQETQSTILQSLTDQQARQTEIEETQLILLESMAEIYETLNKSE